MQAESMFHLHCQKGSVGRYVFLPGDPGRVPKIATYLEQAQLTAQNREFTTYTGFLDGVPVSVTSTGIGGPSAAIAMEELVQCGADTFLRIGTCGGMQPHLVPGTLILPTGAVRMEGTTQSTCRWHFRLFRIFPCCPIWCRLHRRLAIRLKRAWCTVRILFMDSTVRSACRLERS